MSLTYLPKPIINIFTLNNRFKLIIISDKENYVPRKKIVCIIPVQWLKRFKK